MESHCLSCAYGFTATRTIDSAYFQPMGGECEPSPMYLIGCCGPIWPKRLIPPIFFREHGRNTGLAGPVYYRIRARVGNRVGLGQIGTCSPIILTY